MSKFLTREITKQIFSDIGLTVRNGLFDIGMLSDKKLKIQYDTEEIIHNMYVGQMGLESFKMRAILIDLSLTMKNMTINEFLIVFKSDGLIHSVSMSDQEDSFIKVYNNKLNVWKDATVYNQAMILAGFEKLCSLGVMWQICNDFDDLYNAAVQLISN